jgi:SAM-dependent methyltransferase
VNLLRRLCHSTDRVLEVGCGRGYTCLKLAPNVKSLVGIDVSEAAIDEARKLLETHRIGNTSILAGSADELTRFFGPHTFDKVISIDVYEHLAPEDGLAHLSEVYSVLKPKGRYIVVTPNRLTGPHDITRDLFPNARQPLGFHLNETTCAELVGQMRKVGFTRFRSVLPLSFKLQIPFDIIYPSYFFVLIEKLFPRFTQKRLIGRFVLMLSGIILISEKA